MEICDREIFDIENNFIIDFKAVNKISDKEKNQVER